MSKHTPGPWFPVEDSVMVKGTNVLGKFVAKFILGNDEAEKEANTRLIAAAPDLLDALGAMAAAYDFEHFTVEYDRIYETAMKAIAKAEGGNNG